MTSPVLFALRGANNAKGKLGAITDWLGVAIAYFGSILAATTDFHKYIIERRGIDSESEFDLSSSSSLEGISISHSSFKLARHLNYIGEGMFWIGLYIGGVASFGKDAVAWICGTLGLSGIVGFMFVPWILHLLLSRIKYDDDDDAEE
jgi:steroid 5-alpha reductase family enzyme